MTKTRLWKALEYATGRTYNTDDFVPYKGPIIHGKIEASDKNRTGRTDIKAIPCVCDGANGVRRKLGLKDAAVGSTRWLGVTHKDKITGGRFYGPGVHLKHDAGRSAKGEKFSLSELPQGNSSGSSQRGTGGGRDTGRRTRTRREQLMAKAWG